MKYNFEKDLETKPWSPSIINARWFSRAVQAALDGLELEARCYNLFQEDYYLHIKEFLEETLERLTAPCTIPDDEVYKMFHNLPKKETENIEAEQ